VTEQGTKAIEGGVQQSLAAGESIQALMQRITEVAHAVTQIAASSHKQLVGMDQTAAAIVSIKQGSTQNAKGMQQIAHAAQSLHQVGQTLKGLVEQYRLTAATGSSSEDNNRVNGPLAWRGSLRSLGGSPPPRRVLLGKDRKNTMRHRGLKKIPPLKTPPSPLILARGA
jgi:hypothetical protein